MPMLLLWGGIWVFWSEDSVSCPPPPPPLPWVLDCETGLSEVAWDKSASERALLVLLSSLFGTAVAGLEPWETAGGV